MNYLDYQFEALFDLLFSVQGILLLLAYAVFCILAISSPKVRWVALVLLFWSTTLTSPTTSDTTSMAPPLVGPLETMRLQARTLSSAMVIALVLPALLASRGWRQSVVSLGVVAFFFFQLTFSSLELLSDASAKTLLSGLLFTATFVGVGIGASKWIQNVQDANRLLWAFLAAIAIFCMATSLQLMINPKAAIADTRLMGTTANPQFAAIVLATAMLPAFYLLLDKTQPKIGRVAVAVLIGVMSVFLFWTGSRTGMLMTGIGLLAFFRLRLGKLVFAVLIAAIFTTAAYFFFGEASAGNTERFLAGQDTRTYVWTRQWAIFLEHPITGTVTGEDNSYLRSKGENSYLTVAASYGLIGLIPMLLAIVLLAREVKATFSMRWSTDHRAMIDLVLAGFISAAVGAFFEAFLLGQFNTIVLLLLVYAAIGAYVREEAQFSLLHPSQAHPVKQPITYPEHAVPQY